MSYPYHSRRSLRLKEYNYSWPGWYYVTVCTKNRACVLGEILSENIHLSLAGQIIEQCWKELPGRFTSLDLDAHVIMPNHMHGILILGGEPRRGLINQTPTDEKGCQSWILMKNPDLALGKIVRYFKAKSSKLIHDAGFCNFEWQRNYYEHVVRNDVDLYRIRTYIRNNPLQWMLDEENPDAVGQ